MTQHAAPTTVHSALERQANELTAAGHGYPTEGHELADLVLALHNAQHPGAARYCDHAACRKADQFLPNGDFASTDVPFPTDEDEDDE